MTTTITPQKTYVVEGIAALLVLLWVYAALSKWLDYSIFLFQLKRSPLVGWAAVPLSIGLPLAELALAGMLLHTRWLRKGLWLSAGLLLLFNVYISAMLLFSKHVPCSCGGVISTLGWGEHLVLNGAFMALAAVGVWMVRKAPRSGMMDGS